MIIEIIKPLNNHLNSMLNEREQLMIIKGASYLLHDFVTHFIRKVKNRVEKVSSNTGPMLMKK